MILSLQAETSLYAELDKLSAAWEALDRQVKSKVFDLTAMEERLAKMGHDVCQSITPKKIYLQADLGDFRGTERQVGEQILRCHAR